MASTATLGYSAPIMAAQPVDTDTTAAPLASAPDIMSPGLGSVAAQETETQYMDMADESLDSMGLSEDSPAKEGLRNFVQTGDRVVPFDALTDPGHSPRPQDNANSPSQGSAPSRGASPLGNQTAGGGRSSPARPPTKPGRSKTIASLVLRKVGGRAQSPTLKRAASLSGLPPALPMYVSRRGRQILSDQDIWGSTGRMVHRRVDYEDKSDASILPLIGEQFNADRAAMEQMHAAIQSIAKAINTHDGDLRDHERRLDEHTNMRFDDNKFREVHLRAARSTMEELESKVSSHFKTFEATATKQDETVYATICKKYDELLPQLVAEKALSIEASLAKNEASLAETKVVADQMKDYLHNLNLQRPEEGKVVFGEFKSMRE